MSDPMDVVVELITNYAASNKETVWRLTGITSASVLGPKGYRTKAMTGAEEFFFKGVRRGKRGLILEFTPLDASDYTQAEWAQGKSIDAFGQVFHDALIGALGSKASTLSSAINAIANRVKREETAQHAETYDANPAWGSF